jgi:putative transposase
LVLAVVVHRANIQDRDGAKLVFAKAKVKGPWRRMERVWADGGYAGKLIAWVSSLGAIQEQVPSCPLLLSVP